MTTNLTQRRRRPQHEYEIREVFLPRATTRTQARVLLADHAEYGAWELTRVRRYPDGSRRAWLRRPIIRAVLTVDFDEIYDA